MLPIKLFNQYSELESEEHNINYLDQLLIVPTGLDKYQYEVKQDPKYERAIQEIRLTSRSNLFTPKGYCFYCGTKTNNVVPAFLHDGSGYNLWMYTDWRCSSIICETCLSHYGSNHLRYLGSADSIAKNRIEHILDFDPEVVLPSVEASHLTLKKRLIFVSFC